MGVGDAVIVDNALPKSAQTPIHVIGRGKRGKALTNAIMRDLQRYNVAYVAALSEKGVEAIGRVGQAVANSVGQRVTATPERKEIEIASGTYRLALVLEIRVGDIAEQGAESAKEGIDVDND